MKKNKCITSFLGFLLLSSNVFASTIRIDGSSTVYPITEAVAEEFQAAGLGKVTVGISGTGGGFKKFIRGEIDIADASRPIQGEEKDLAYTNGQKFIELPIAFDALTIVINPANICAATLTIAELKKIWEPAAQGKITNWNQVKPECPKAPLKLYGPGSDSGTFDYFTEAIVGKAKASRGDYTASEDDNVLVQGIANDKNALGYFGYAYYVENRGKLKAVAVVGKSGPVVPNEASVKDGTYNPLSRPIFIYVNAKSAERPEVKEFVEFYLKNAANLAKQVKYIPFSADIYARVLERFEKKQLGTAFGDGGDVGLKVGEILDRTPKL